MSVERSTDNLLSYSPEGRLRDERRAGGRETCAEVNSLNDAHRMIAPLFAKGMKTTDVQRYLQKMGVNYSYSYLAQLRSSDLMRQRIEELQVELESEALNMGTRHKQMAQDAMLFMEEVMHGVVTEVAIDGETNQVATDEDGNIIQYHRNVGVKERMTAAKHIAETHPDTAPVQRVKPAVQYQGPSEDALKELRERTNAAMREREQHSIEVQAQ